MNQAPEIIKQNNAAHEEANAQYQAFINGGGKVITELPVKKKKKGTINLKSTPKHHRELEGMANIQKVEWLINHYKELTTNDIQSYAGIHKSEVFRCARLLENDGVITRENAGGMGAETYFKKV